MGNKVVKPKCFAGTLRLKDGSEFLVEIRVSALTDHSPCHDCVGYVFGVCTRDYPETGCCDYFAPLGDGGR